MKTANVNTYLIYCIGAIFLAFSVFYACLLGPVDIGWKDAVYILSKKLFANGVISGGLATKAAILWELRLSRVVLATLVGMALAVSGAAFQGVLINPLADPFTIGVASGAAFGATLAIFLGGGGAWGPDLLQGLGVIPIFSFIGALATLVFVLAFSRLAGGLRRETMILSGIVVATFLAALISLMKSLDEESVQAIVFWIMGSLQGRSWIHVGFVLPYVFLGMGLILWRSRELDILTFGDEQARQIGVDVDAVRRLVLVGASVLTAACVSVTGVIGFVGLVTPHMVRLVIGARHRPLFLASALLGGIIMVWSDAIARTLLPSGEEIPVGVITALLGGPIFFIILVKNRRGRLATHV